MIYREIITFEPTEKQLEFILDLFLKRYYKQTETPAGAVTCSVTKIIKIKDLSWFERILLPKNAKVIIEKEDAGYIA